MAFDDGHYLPGFWFRDLYKIFYMQTISFQHLSVERTRKTISFPFAKRLAAITPEIIENRFGVVVALIVIQFTIAGFNVTIPPIAGASIWAITPGIFMAFMSNSIALAQARMRWVLSGFALSILINGGVSLYYGIQLLA